MSVITQTGRETLLKKRPRKRPGDRTTVFTYKHGRESIAKRRREKRQEKAND